jgi:hypothetical protein
MNWAVRIEVIVETAIYVGDVEATYGGFKKIIRPVWGVE